MTDKIKEYWNERANLFNDKSSTTNDIWLRELEIRNFCEILNYIKIHQKGEILDVGCGDGYSTINIAKKFPNFSFDGIDFSKNMIKIASSQLEQEESLNINFQVGSVLQLDKKYKKKFDVVITDRCLINLNSVELQKKAFIQIAKILKNGGYYIGIENFVDGQNQMNDARKKMKLAEIPIRWHNLFFEEKKFKEMIKDEFKLIDIKNFSSSYYFATRIIYSKMCKMKEKEPDYNHEIHQLAIDLPYFGNFSPIKCIILQKKGKENER